MADKKHGGRKPAKSTKIGRDAITGQFITTSEAKIRPKTSVIETIRKPIKSCK